MEMNDLSRRVGSREQLAYVRRATLTEGKADGLKIIEAANAEGLSFTLFENRGLDIARLSFKGVNMGFICKAGWVSPQNFSAVGNNYSQYFQGGMLYTCGLENVGPAGKKGSRYLPIHGSLGMTPADNVYTNVNWEKGVIEICGTMRSSGLFGQNILMERKVSVPIFEKRVIIEDTVSNDGFSEEEMMLLYHFNFGYPMLSESSKLYINEDGLEPRDEKAAAGRERWNVFEAPTDGRPEEVYYHNPKAENDGLCHVKIENSELNIGAEVVFDKKELPQLVQWKTMRSGDYALGIEPSTVRVSGYQNEKEEGRVITLAPGEKRKFTVSLNFYEL